MTDARVTRTSAPQENGLIQIEGLAVNDGRSGL
jgi:hypothetical protein